MFSYNDWFVCSEVILSKHGKSFLNLTFCFLSFSSSHESCRRRILYRFFASTDSKAIPICFCTLGIIRLFHPWGIPPCCHISPNSLYKRLAVRSWLTFMTSCLLFCFLSCTFVTVACVIQLVWMCVFLPVVYCLLSLTSDSTGFHCYQVLLAAFICLKVWCVTVLSLRFLKLLLCH